MPGWCPGGVRSVSALLRQQEWHGYPISGLKSAAETPVNPCDCRTFDTGQAGTEERAEPMIDFGLALLPSHAVPNEGPRFDRTLGVAPDTPPFPGKCVAFFVLCRIQLACPNIGWTGGIVGKRSSRTRNQSGGENPPKHGNPPFFESQSNEWGHSLARPDQREQLAAYAKLFDDDELRRIAALIERQTAGYVTRAAKK